jgi:pilin isopeptide linkage protein/LPXTG-motif cell wall-anchored protein
MTTVPVFRNYASSVSVTLGGTKTLYGRNMDAGEFEFKLTEVQKTTETTDDTAETTDTATTVSTTTAPAAEAGEPADFTFDPITYQYPGVYTYTIEESQGKGDVQYDQRTWTAVVTVTEVDSKLEASVAYSCSNGEKCAPAFQNYAAAYMNIDAYKTLNGRAMRSGEFKFVLAPQSFVVKRIELRDGKLLSESSNVLPQAPRRRVTAQTKTTTDTATETTTEMSQAQLAAKALPSYYAYAPAADEGQEAKVIFADVAFTKAGSYEYIMYEDQTDPITGVTYDESVWAVHVKVEESEKGLVVTELTYQQKNAETGTYEAPVEKATFVNTAEPDTPTTPTKPKTPEESEKPTPSETPEKPTPSETPEKPTPSETPDEPAATVETPDEPTEQPTETEQPQVSEQPTETETPRVSEQPTETEQPQVSKQPTETVPETSVAPTPQTTSGTGSMPQTGQDWWPMLLLAAAGILLIAAGILRNKKHRT